MTSSKDIVHLRRVESRVLIGCCCKEKGSIEWENLRAIPYFRSSSCVQAKLQVFIYFTVLTELKKEWKVSWRKTQFDYIKYKIKKN